MSTLKTALIALAAVAACAPVASAEVVKNQNQVTVQTNDLDLNNPRDAETLLKRINQAANAACKDWETVIPNAQRSCVKHTVSENVARLNINALGVAYADAYGQQPALASRD